MKMKYIAPEMKITLYAPEEIIVASAAETTTFDKVVGSDELD